MLMKFKKNTKAKNGEDENGDEDSEQPQISQLDNKFKEPCLTELQKAMGVRLSPLDKKPEAGKFDMS